MIGARPRRPRLVTVLAAVVVGALCSACGGHEAVRIGSKKFTEGVILGEVLRLALVADGQSSEHIEQMGGSRIVFEALAGGSIDAYVDYTGTLQSDILVQEKLAGRDELAASLEKRGIRLGPTLGFNNTYALGLRRARAEELGLRRISDLRDHPEVRFGFSHEFLQRADGWPGLKRRYGLPQEDVTGLDHDLAYRALDQGDLDGTDVYSTDAKIQVHDLVVLEDDLLYFPAYDAVILYRTALEETRPRAVEVFERLRDAIDETEMIRMNAAVDVDKRSDADAAAAYLTQELGTEVVAAPDSWLDRVIQRTREHLGLVLASLVIAVLIGLSLGIFAARNARVGQVVIGIVGAAQTMPGLALLALMVPWLGIGWLPTLFALVVYSLLPIVRNTHAGIVGIPRPLRESAEVLGLSPRTRLWKIELPLAAPSILAGVKTAAIWNVGLATLGALVGAGGYGQPIMEGIRTDDTPLILEGAVPAILLALLLQLFFEALERRVVSRGLRPTPGA